MATPKKTSTSRKKKVAEVAVVETAILAAPPEVAAPVGPYQPQSIAVDEPPTAPITQAQIRDRAYALYLANGGSAFETWIRAERELLATSAPTS